MLMQQAEMEEVILHYAYLGLSRGYLLLVLYIVNLICTDILID